MRCARPSQLDRSRASLVGARGLRALLLVGLALALVAPPAAAKPYTDTKKRFALELEAGWELAPIPADTLGMNFRKKMNGVPGSLHVMVRPLKPAETTKQTLDELEEGFKAELGYKAGGDLPTSVGLLPAMRRTFSVFASGDEKTVRAIEIYALHAFGHAHVLHFETLEKSRSAFSRDLDRMLAGYQALAGKGDNAPLVGTWINLDGGTDLLLEEDGSFKLGPLSGGFKAERGGLTLYPAQGAAPEAFSYVLDGNSLTVANRNVGEMRFKRSGAARFKEGGDKPKVTGPLTREQLIGGWKVVDAASTEPLRLQLAPTGSCSFGPLSGRWRYATGRLTITSTADVTITYAASLTEGKLVLSGGDLERELTLVRE